MSYLTLIFGMFVSFITSFFGLSLSVNSKTAASAGDGHPVKRTAHKVNLDMSIMTGDHVGFAIGELPSGSEYGNLVLKSTDGGALWSDITPTTTMAGKRVMCAGFAGPNTMAFVSVGNNQKVQVYVTKNGGTSWQASNIFSTHYGDGNVDLQFINALDGVLEISTAGMGTLQGDLFVTRDGGQSWSRVASSMSGSLGQKGYLPFAEGISFQTANNGWMGGFQRAAGEFGGPGFLWLFRTTDGGSRWTHVHLPVPNGWATALTSVGEPQWFANRGYLTVEYMSHSNPSQKSFLYQTSDSGSHWVCEPLPGTGMASVDFVNSKTGYTLAADTLWRTDNGGRSWTKVASDQHWASATMQFVNRDAGWISYYNNEGVYFERTTDGGLHWSFYRPRLWK